MTVTILILGNQLQELRVRCFLINVSTFDMLPTGSVGATNMNEHSSRSHAIFTITIECSEKGIDGNQHVRMGKLHLVDLAVRRTSQKLSKALIMFF